MGAFVICLHRCAPHHYDPLAPACIAVVEADGLSSRGLLHRESSVPGDRHALRSAAQFLRKGSGSS